MFKETPDGQTHYENDGCGEPEHNILPEMDEEYYKKAKQVIFTYGKVSAALLQNTLKIGYSKAAYLLDLLEERGVISPSNGTSPRKILESKRKTDGWEAEFDTLFVDKSETVDVIHFSANPIKHFIRELLKEKNEIEVCPLGLNCKGSNPIHYRKFLHMPKKLWSSKKT